MLGGVLSTGVTMKVQVAAFPAASVAVMVTAVAEVIAVPTTGLCVITSAADPVQLSVALTRAV